MNRQAPHEMWHWDTTLRKRKGNCFEMHIDGAGCNGQYVQIYDGYWNSGPLLSGEICYHATEVFRSSSNVMTVTYINGGYGENFYGFFGAHYSSSRPLSAGPPTIGPPTYETTTPDLE
ncbi:deleted in malignant brain tumors 1 protein-like [Hyla sarda]|uniref:deleted in malignant brain tumors 1 protein-like n=1 Tax=Hyla sarda TaxID=327740 RepID=UPI0024C418C9|nr:deleted in malignant brain tumors 1 protein-like [Hyla sarda]